MGWLRAIPLLVFPAILYAAVAKTMEHSAIRASFDQVFLSLNLPSGAIFTVTRGHALTMLAAGLLFIEIVATFARVVAAATAAPPLLGDQRKVAISIETKRPQFSPGPLHFCTN